MEEFPNGGWSLTEYDRFNDWTSTIRQNCPPSAVVKDVCGLLLGFHQAMDRILSPDENDDDTGDEAEEEVVEASSPRAEHKSETIRSKPAQQVSSSYTPEEGIRAVKPGVSFLVLNLPSALLQPFPLVR